MPDDYLDDPTRGLLERIKRDVEGARTAIRDMAQTGDFNHVMSDPFEHPLKCLDAAVADLNLLLGIDGDGRPVGGRGPGNRRNPRAARQE